MKEFFSSFFSSANIIEGAEVHSPGQAKRRPGYNVLCSLRPVRAKVLKQSVLCLLLPLQGVA